MTVLSVWSAKGGPTELLSVKVLGIPSEEALEEASVLDLGRLYGCEQLSQHLLYRPRKQAHGVLVWDSKLNAIIVPLIHTQVDVGVVWGWTPRWTYGFMFCYWCFICLLCQAYSYSTESRKGAALEKINREVYVMWERNTQWEENHDLSWIKKKKKKKKKD